MKKKIFTLLLAVAASVGTMFAWDYERVQICDLYYNLDQTNKTAEVTYKSYNYNNDYYNEDWNVTTANIPSSVKYNSVTYSVTSIGNRAFYECSSLTSVTIPNSVTSIGNYAFIGCTGLTSPVYNAHVFAFMPTSYSGAFTIPDGIESIAGGAFGGCRSLTSVTIPNSVTSIGENAFSGTGLTSPVYNAHVFAFMPTSYSGAFTIQDGIESIADGAFSGCSSLTSVTIPNSVTSIGDYAFSGCSRLTSVTIPNSVTSIGNYAFYGCSSLTSVTIPNSVTSIGESAFSGCSSLTSVTIPNSVTSIGSFAFAGCSSLTSITIPNSVTRIGSYAFAGCSGLTSITIPNSVTSIKDHTFFGCTSLTSVTIPNSVTSIGWNAFYNCSSLTSVTIPNSVTSIEESAFSGCSSLTSVTIAAETPPTLGSLAFDGTNNCPIYVPCGTLDAYKNAEGWSGYASRIKYVPLVFVVTGLVTETMMGRVVVPITLCDDTLITAVPNYGYQFIKWADGNTDNPRTIELTQDTTMEAIFDYLLEGKCGKDSALTWTFEPASMALNITGKGALSENYTYGIFIESLTIGNEITSIGEWAFGECNNLKTVIIGSSVKVLEQGAFAYCSSIESITCYSQRPPTVNQDALYGLDYSTIVYVPADYLNTYKMHNAWGLYDVRPLGAKGTETTNLSVTPAETTADVAWPAISGAATYELVIKDKGGNVICTLVFNANGQLTQIAFNAPARNNAPQQTQTASFSFTVTGLNSGTTYNYTLTSKDAAGNVLDTQTGAFTTDGATALDNTYGNQNAGIRKVFENGQLYILNGSKTYNLQGMEIK